ncbi:MAG: DUF4364 family protein [Eubacterium sp.]|nr:DUF4364 family protein [Eubacterium sp.]
MTSAPVDLNKQIILHILHRASLSLPQSILLDIITDLGYADYIQAQSALGELVESELVEESATYHRTYVTLTETGEEACLLFENSLSSDIRREINEYLRTNHIETLDETALVSDYRLTGTGTYRADCKLRDGSHTLYEISLEVASEKDAIRICDAWETQAQTLYAEALRTLLSNYTEKSSDSET